MNGKNKDHPERCTGELFVCNATEYEYSQIPFRTKRMGNVAYDAEGKVIPDAKPVFMSVRESMSLGLI